MMILLFFFCFILCINCVPKKTIVFVISYRAGFVYSDDDDNGAVQGLAETGWFQDRTVRIIRLYMYTKSKNTDLASKLKVAEEVEKNITAIDKQYGIDLIVTFDDDAFLYVGCKNRTQRVVFSGANGLPEHYNKVCERKFMDSRIRPGHNVTGIWEKESLLLVSYIFPKVEGSTIRCFMEDTIAGDLIGESIVEMSPRIKADQNISVEVYTLKYFSNYSKLLEESCKNSSVQAIFLILHTLIGDDGKKIPSSYTIPWTGQRCKLPDLASSAPNSKMGLLGGIGTYVEGMGKFAGRYAGRVLSGEVIGEIPIITSPPMVFFNLDRLLDLGVTIEPDILAYAAEVFYTPVEPIEPVFDYDEPPYNPTALIISLTLFFLFWCSSCCCCCVGLCFLLVPIVSSGGGLISVICCLLCAGGCMCDLGCIFCLRYRKFKRKFRKVDVDQMLLEWRDYQDSAGEQRVKVDINQIDYKTLKLIKVIGKGGQNSTVFVAKWSGKQCAYKSYTSLGDQNLEDFQIESTILGSLQHPNILRFYGCVCSMESKIRRVGIVMEYCELGDLYTFLMDKMLLEEIVSWSDRLKYLGEIADGMEYLHDKKIIHRDLKLRNVLVKDDNCIRIIDFGLSKQTAKANQNLQHTTRIGTPFFMAPEIIKGHYYDEKVDVYSFAIIMYCLLTLKLNPYEDFKDEDNRVVEQKVCTDPQFRPPIPEKILGGEDSSLGSLGELEWFISLMRSCWDHDPVQRPAFSVIKIQMTEKKKTRMSRRTRQSLDIPLSPMSVFGDEEVKNYGNDSGNVIEIKEKKEEDGEEEGEEEEEEEEEEEIPDEDSSDGGEDALDQF